MKSTPKHRKGLNRWRSRHSTGAVLGWLAGIGSLAIPGVGPFIAAGPIMAALGGAAVGQLQAA